VRFRRRRDGDVRSWRCRRKIKTHLVCGEISKQIYYAKQILFVDSFITRNPNIPTINPFITRHARYIYITILFIL